MGGWYLQPDCLIPSGESFIRQIETGNKYFFEKFGIKPTTAINFDSFGHTRGLVQILAKSGYNSYVFMRPYGFVPENDFIWKGFDGSEIIGHCLYGCYGTDIGQTIPKLENVQKEKNQANFLVCWGIGNHSGGVSKAELEAFEEYRSSHPEVNIIHSNCKDYFDTVDKTKLNTVERSIIHTMIGCYTSMSRVKKEHRKVENELLTCEKMLAQSGIDFDKAELKKAEKAMLFNEFHDILPGTGIKKVENDALTELGYAREILERNITKAFFKLCEGQPKCKNGEIPVIVYNPLPNPVKRTIEAEFNLAMQNRNLNEVTLVKVRDKNGNYLPVQNEQEDSNIIIDWRKKVVFEATLEPMSINRYDLELRIENHERRPVESVNQTDTHFIFTNKRSKVAISKKTGLIDIYNVDGKDILKPESAKINVYQDNEDPWGMTVSKFGNLIGEFKLLSKKEANAFNGYPDETINNVRIIENGPVRAKVQATFKYMNSYAVVTYTISKNDTYIDINVKIFSNDVMKMYKMAFDTSLSDDCKFIGQTAFGREALAKNREVTFQKWCYLNGENDSFAIINKGTYAGNVEGNKVSVSLIRTPIYSAHPIGGRDRICDKDRYHDHIDMGEHEFDFRITADISHIDYQAEVYNSEPYVLSFFPSGEGIKKDIAVEIESKDIIMSAYKKLDNGDTLIRLFNTQDEHSKTTLTICENTFDVEFSPFEIKTFTFSKNKLNESDLIVL